MSFDWADFLTLAHELSTSPAGDQLREAKLRSAISRAYYASFHHARNYYKARYKREPPGSGAAREHASLPTALTESGRPNEKQAGRYLSELRRYRRKADYKVSPMPDDWYAIQALQLARDIIDILQA